MDSYAIRIDLAGATKEELLTCFTDSTILAYAIENIHTDNPHIQLYIETNTKSHTLRARIKKYGSGNGFYSLKKSEYRSLKYIAYLMKQGDFYPGALPSELIEEASKIDEEYKQNAKKETGQTVNNIVNLIEEWHNDIPTKIGIQTAIIRYHLDRGLLIRKFQCQAYYDTIYCRYSTLEESLSHIFN